MHLVGSVVWDFCIDIRFCLVVLIKAVRRWSCDDWGLRAIPGFLMIVIEERILCMWLTPKSCLDELLNFTKRFQCRLVKRHVQKLVDIKRCPTCCRCSYWPMIECQGVTISNMIQAFSTLLLPSILTSLLAMDRGTSSLFMNLRGVHLLALLLLALLPVYPYDRNAMQAIKQRHRPLMSDRGMITNANELTVFQHSSACPGCRLEHLWYRRSLRLGVLCDQVISFGHNGQSPAVPTRVLEECHSSATYRSSFNLRQYSYTNSSPKYIKVS